MKIALINENSQADKNKIIAESLVKTVGPMGHEVFNYGMYSSADENPLTYVHIGVLAALLINSGAADYIVTGCGTGEGAMLSCNSFPGVICGYVADPTDAFLFSQINNGNAISLPFAKGFGWGAELNLNYIFEKLFSAAGGQGYPSDRAEPQKRNKKILDSVRTAALKPLIDILGSIKETGLVKGAVSGPHFKEYFFANCKDPEIASYVKTLID